MFAIKTYLVCSTLHVHLESSTSTELSSHENALDRHESLMWTVAGPKTLLLTLYQKETNKNGYNMLKKILEWLNYLQQYVFILPL